MHNGLDKIRNATDDTTLISFQHINDTIKHYITQKKLDFKSELWNINTPPREQENG